MVSLNIKCQNKGKEIIQSIKKYVRTNILFLTYLITSFINSTLVRFFTVQNFLDFRPILADIAVITLIGSFGYFVKPKHQFKYFFTWSIIFIFVCIVNSMYYTNYMSFASFSLLATSTQIVDVGDAIVNNVMEIRDFCYLWQIVAMICVHAFLKKKNYYEKIEKTEIGKESFKKTLFGTILIFILFILFCAPTDWGKFQKQWNREFVVMRFGLYLYQGNDLISSLQPQLSPLFGYDKAVKEYYDFYKEKENVQTENEYTDIFKGKNILVIHAESIQDFTLHTSFNGKEVTPTLNKLAKEGLYFSNFYAQESVGTSSDSEFTFSSSLLPVSNGTVFINYFDRNYVTTQKLLSDMGYYTFSMHGNKGTFWNRNIVHPNLGYQDFFNQNNFFEIDEKIGLGLSDESFFNQAIPKIKEISENYDNFFGTMIMLTNHTPFSWIEEFSDYEVNYTYKVTLEDGTVVEKTDPYLEGTVLGSYFKSVHYADEALGKFIEDLDSEGLLENTVLVIYGDHDNKLKKKEYEKFFHYLPLEGRYLEKGDEGYYDFNNYEYELNRKVPFIIWSKNDTLQKEVTEVMGMYDISPTLGNMFGFHNEFALGHDIFGTEENIVVFPDGNWLTNKVYYNNQKEESYALTKEAVSQEYILQNTEYADKIVSISNDIIIHDLIEKVGNIWETKKKG